MRWRPLYKKKQKTRTDRKFCTSALYTGNGGFFVAVHIYISSLPNLGSGALPGRDSDPEEQVGSKRLCAPTTVLPAATQIRGHIVSAFPLPLSPVRHSDKPTAV